MTKKLIWRMLKVSFAILILLVCTLAIHIYLVTKPNNKEGEVLKQLSRIDFAEAPMDSTTAVQATTAIQQIPEVLSHYLNQETGALVYTVEAGDNRAQLVFESFMEKGDFNAIRYIPTQESLAKSCPVINKKSFTYQLGEFFKNLFS